MALPGGISVGGRHQRCRSDHPDPDRQCLACQLPDGNRSRSVTPTPRRTRPLRARILQVTVNDGLLDSAVATTTVTVTAANDAPVANNDTVITNVAANTAFSVSQAALARQRYGPEGSGRHDHGGGWCRRSCNGPTLGSRRHHPH